jgi:hypothetical protein
VKELITIKEREELSFKIKQEAIRNIMSVTNVQFSTWGEDLNAIQQSIDEIINLESFQGKTAETVKSYLEEVHYIIIHSIINTMMDFQNKFLLYSNGYYKIDKDKCAVLPKDALQYAQEELAIQRKQIEEEAFNLRNAINDIQDILYMPIPSSNEVIDNYKNIENRIKDLEREIEEYEQAKIKTDLLDLENLIQAVRRTIKEYTLSTNTSIEGYTKGDYAKSQNIQMLAKQLQISSMYSETHKEELKEAL